MDFEAAPAPVQCSYYFAYRAIHVLLRFNLSLDGGGGGGVESIHLFKKLLSKPKPQPLESTPVNYESFTK